MNKEKLLPFEAKEIRKDITVSHEYWVTSQEVLSLKSSARLRKGLVNSNRITVAGITVGL